MSSNLRMSRRNVLCRLTLIRDVAIYSVARHSGRFVYIHLITAGIVAPLALSRVHGNNQMDHSVLLRPRTSRLGTAARAGARRGNEVKRDAFSLAILRTFSRGSTGGRPRNEEGSQTVLLLPPVCNEQRESVCVVRRARPPARPARVRGAKGRLRWCRLQLSIVSFCLLVYVRATAAQRNGRPLLAAWHAAAAAQAQVCSTF